MTTSATPPSRRRPPARRPDRGRRSPGAVAASLAVHGALVALLGHALTQPSPYLALLGRLAPPPQAERVTYVQPQRAAAPLPEPEGGGDGRPAAPPVPRPSAPLRTPDAIAPPAPDAAPTVEPSAAPRPAAPGRGTGQGSGVGELTGPAAGLRPTYTGGAVWLRPGDPTLERPTLADSLDDVVMRDLARIRDSLTIEAMRRSPDDWTFQRNGQRYGLTRDYLHLGKISIPTPLLGLIPMRQQGNPVAAQRNRALNEMGAESRDQARRMEDAFNVDARIAEIRKRRDAERAARRGRAAGNGGGPP